MKRLLVLVGTCALGAFSLSAADEATKVSGGYFIFPGGFETQTLTPTADGNFDDAEVTRLIRANYKTLDFLQTRVVANGKVTETARVNFFNKFKEITVARNSTPMFSSRRYLSTTAGGGLNYFFEISAKAKYEYLLEIDHTQADAAYNLAIKVNPYDLMLAQVAGQLHAARRFIIFSKMIMAPALLFRHQLVDTQANASFPVFFSSSGSYVSNVKENFNGKLALRRYANAAAADEFYKSTDPMFIEVGPGPLPDSEGDNIAPQDLMITYAGRRYQLSPRYAQHLSAEGVTFSMPTNAKDYRAAPSNLHLNAAALTRLALNRDGLLTKAMMETASFDPDVPSQFPATIASLAIADAVAQISEKGAAVSYVTVSNATDGEQESATIVTAPDSPQ